MGVQFHDSVVSFAVKEPAAVWDDSCLLPDRLSACACEKRGDIYTTPIKQATDSLRVRFRPALDLRLMTGDLCLMS